MPDIFALDDACSTAVMRTLVRVARAVRASFTPDGVNVMQSNGAAAGQEVLHLHFHVVPRTEGDGMLHYYPAARSPVPRSDLDKQAALIAGHL